MNKTPSYASSLRMPVYITDGHIKLINGKPLPALHKEAFAELVLDASALVNADDRLRLTRESAIQILEQGSTLWARVAIDEIPASLRPHRESKKTVSASAHAFVKMVIEAPLRLIGSEGKQPVFAECQCRIPCLPHVQCASVNEAYTRISEVFEPSRRSHTGNVFGCVFFENQGVLCPLKNLRNQSPSAMAPGAGELSLT